MAYMASRKEASVDDKASDMDEENDDFIDTFRAIKAELRVKET